MATKKQRLNDGSAKSVETSDSEDTNHVQFDETAFRKMMECPICLDYVSPDCISCTSGHIMCKQCYKQYIKTNHKCFCKGSFYDNKPIMVQQIYDNAKIKIDCPFKNKGCDVVMLINDYWEHKKSCQYRTHSCFYKNCSQIFDTDIDIETLIKHYIEKHDCMLSDYKDNIMKIKFTDNVLGKYIIFRLNPKVLIFMKFDSYYQVTSLINKKIGYILVTIVRFKITHQYFEKNNLQITALSSGKNVQTINQNVIEKDENSQFLLITQEQLQYMKDKDNFISFRLQEYQFPVEDDESPGKPSDKLNNQLDKNKINEESITDLIEQL